jgi:hypothetical protein
MTIHDAGRAVLAKGQSLDDETWEQALLRIYQATLWPHAPARRIVYANRRARQTGAATNAVTLGYRDDSGREVSEFLFILTDPPQF